MYMFILTVSPDKYILLRTTKDMVVFEGGEPTGHHGCTREIGRRIDVVYRIEDLKAAWMAGEKYKFLFFWGHQPPPEGGVDEGCLSQWWPCRFTVDGADYSCAEQFMMAEKARLFGDRAMLEAIMAAKRPKEMKAYGRAVQNFDQTLWSESCYELVLRGNLAKFSQDPALSAYLLGTKNRILVEASPRDRIWGIGMGKRNPDAENPMKWRGRNLLGFALTEARDRLRSGEESPIMHTNRPGAAEAAALQAAPESSDCLRVIQNEGDGAYWVYILRCADDTLYTGITDDVERRIAAHNSGKGAKYTRGRGPVKVVYRERCPDKPAALRREWAIKRLSRKEKLRLIGES